MSNFKEIFGNIAASLTTYSVRTSRDTNRIIKRFNEVEDKRNSLRNLFYRGAMLEAHALTIGGIFLAHPLKVLFSQSSTPQANNTGSLSLILLSTGLLVIPTVSSWFLKGSAKKVERKTGTPLDRLIHKDDGELKMFLPLKEVQARVLG